jgi:hypothetical protein
MYLDRCWTLKEELFQPMSTLGTIEYFGLQLQCPLYPQKRTFAVHSPMSALGQKRTHAVQQKASLLDHLIGAR